MYPPNQISIVIEHGKDTTFKILWEQWHTNGYCIHTIQHNRDGENNRNSNRPMFIAGYISQLFNKVWSNYRRWKGLLNSYFDIILCKSLIMLRVNAKTLSTNTCPYSLNSWRHHSWLKCGFFKSLISSKQDS